MMKRVIPIILLIALIGGGYWWYSQPTVTALEANRQTNQLVGSGSIEAETVAITAELGGRVLELKVDEGDEVEAGQTLVELDKAELLARQLQLEAALTTAQTNLELASATARPEEIAVAQAQLSQANLSLEGAEQTWTQLRDLVSDPHELEASVSQAKAQVTEAEKALEMAKVNLKRADIEAEAASRNQSNHEALVQYEVAQYRQQSARQQVEMAQIALAGAKRQVAHLVNMREHPLQLVAQANSAGAAHLQAEAAVQVAQANLTAVKADPTAEDVAVAQAQVREAEAALAAIEVQLAKQTLTAPRAGLISKKLVNPGELANPGAVLLELSDIETVDLTVYIPETRVGQVKIGQKAQVYVDAYENEIFEGWVSFMAHEAEFTPRNVQTQEERVNLVFAVKITLDNADHRLKPGMPADAEILPDTLVELATPSAPAKPAATVTPTPSAEPAKPSATPAATATTTAAKTMPARQAKVLTWWLNVRSGPGVDYPVVAGLAKGDTVSVLKKDVQTGWLQVRLPNEQSGWITNSPAYVAVK